MSRPSVSRRKPRRIAHVAVEDDGEDMGPVVRKPTSAAPKQKSRLRMLSAPEPEGTREGDQSQLQETKEPSRLTFTRFPSKGDARTAPAAKLPLRAPQNDERPSYNRDYLAELRESTSARPKTSWEDEEASKQTSAIELQIAGPQTSIYDENSTAILSAAEIAEKKERRARLAKEHDYIPLEDEDSADWRISRYKPEKDTRLVREDEDFGEGFDSFVDDGTVALGRKAELAQEKRQHAEARELIDAAEGSSEDDSDAERNFAYEAAQTRAGMDGLTRLRDQRISAGKPPTIITPIPKIGAVVERLRQRLLDIEQKSALLSKQKEALQREKLEVAEREKEIQALVTEAGAKYEKAKQEAEFEGQGIKTLEGTPHTALPE